MSATDEYCRLVLLAIRSHASPIESTTLAVPGYVLTSSSAIRLYCSAMALLVNLSVQSVKPASISYTE